MGDIRLTLRRMQRYHNLTEGNSSRWLMWSRRQDQAKGSIFATWGKGTGKGNEVSSKNFKRRKYDAKTNNVLTAAASEKEKLEGTFQGGETSQSYSQKGGNIYVETQASPLRCLACPAMKLGRSRFWGKGGGKRIEITVHRGGGRGGSGRPKHVAPSRKKKGVTMRGDGTEKVRQRARISYEGRDDGEVKQVQGSPVEACSLRRKKKKSGMLHTRGKQKNTAGNSPKKRGAGLSRSPACRGLKGGGGPQEYYTGKEGGGLPKARACERTLHIGELKSQGQSNAAKSLFGGGGKNTGQVSLRRGAYDRGKLLWSAGGEKNTTRACDRSRLQSRGEQGNKGGITQ